MPELVPITVKAALKLVKQWHRKLPDLQGGLFAVGVADPDLRGVGVAGNPSRVWQGQAKLVISRCAIDGIPNGCSMVYGALARAAKALGYREVWTYTLPDEPGTSLRAAGFEDMGISDGGTYARPSRFRKPPVCPQPKRRWRRRLAAQNPTEVYPEGTYCYMSPSGWQVTMWAGNDPGCVLCAPGSCSARCDAQTTSHGNDR